MDVYSPELETFPRHRHRRVWQEWNIPTTVLYLGVLLQSKMDSHSARPSCQSSDGHLCPRWERVRRRWEHVRKSEHVVWSRSSPIWCAREALYTPLGHQQYLRTVERLNLFAVRASLLHLGAVPRDQTRPLVSGLRPTCCGFGHKGGSTARLKWSVIRSDKMSHRTLRLTWSRAMRRQSPLLC